MLIASFVIDATSDEFLNTHKPLPLGYEDETGITAVVFDISKLGWNDIYGADGTLELRFWRPTEGDGYLVPLTKTSNESGCIWTWNVSAADLEHNGSGYIQLFYKKTGMAKASHWWNIYVQRSIEIGSVSHEQFQQWYDSLEEIAWNYNNKLGDPNDLRTDNKTSIVGAINETYWKAFGPKVEKVDDYAYEAWYGDLDYENAYRYFKEKGDIPIGGCSAVRNGNFYGRNLDWEYNHQAEFVVHVPKIGSRHASFGVASNIAELTDEFVSSGEYSELYKVLPFNMMDGINDAGVFANVNVVPKEKGDNTYVAPLLDQKVELSAGMLIRYILDNFASATDAVEFIRDHATIYFPKHIHDRDYELHFIIGDSEDNYVLEFVSGAVSIVEANYMTNFHLSGTVFNADGTVYTPETQDATHDAERTNLITPHSAGLERWNLIVNGYPEADDYEGMRDLLDKLKYTRAYGTSDDPADPVWHTEFVSKELGLTASSPAADFATVEAAAGVIFANRSRDAEGVNVTWQTVHSVIYDISEKTAKIIFQESGVEYTFELGGDEGATDHRALTHRDDPNQHPISAIAGLQNELDSKSEFSGSYNDLTDKPTIPEPYTLPKAGSAYGGVKAGNATDDDNAPVRITADGYLRVKALQEHQSLAEYRKASAQDVIDNAITAKIPPQASSSNQLADKAFVNSSIENVAAYYITKNAAGDPFATKAELDAATVFYSGGAVRTPTRNDYAIVLHDETHTDSVSGEDPTTRYLYYDIWQFQYVVNNSGLTAAQLAVLNSGISAEKVADYDEHIDDDDIHVTAEEKESWDGKMDEIAIDTEVAEGSDNLITSGAVYEALSQFPTEIWNGGSY